MYYCHAKINCIFIIVESNPKENSSPSSSSEVLGSSPQVPSSCPQVPGSSFLKLAAAVLKLKAIQYQKLLIYFLRNMFTTMTYARQNVFKVLSLFVLLKKKTKKPTSCNIAGLRIRRCHTVKQQTYGGQFSQKERVYIVTFVENMIQ